MKNNIGRTIALWRSFFPRSLEEARNEKCRGDVFTWEGTLEARSGALASMACFLRFCPDQVDQDLIKKVMSLIETVLATLSNTSDLLFTHGTQLRPAICLLRIRLYMLLNQLQTSDLEAIYTPILRELLVFTFFF